MIPHSGKKPKTTQKKPTKPVAKNLSPLEIYKLVFEYAKITHLPI